MFKVGVVLSALASIMSIAAAAGPITGVWHGHVTFDVSKLPPMTDPNQKKMMMAQIKSQEQIKITLTLKGDKTFTIVAIGGPRQQPPVTGTYTATASVLTIRPVVKGKTIDQVFNIAKDGKSMTLSQGPASVTFLR